MKAYFDIIQGTEEWHEIRYGKIGGTSSKQLMIDSNSLIEEILSTRLEPFEPLLDVFESYDMQRGTELEPMAREELSKYTGIDFLECGWLESETHHMLGISPDGISADFKASCEIKCPARKKHTANLRCNGIPAEYLPQCVHNFTVNPDLEVHYFLSFRPENKYRMFVKKMTRSSLVDLGTKSKPVVKTVSEWVDIAKSKHDLLDVIINEELKRLEF